MKENEKVQWENTRKKGIINFILFRGILMWGLPMAIFISFILPLIKGYGFSYFVSKEFINFIPSDLFIYLLAGIGYGIIIWEINEHKYKKQ